MLRKNGFKLVLAIGALSLATAGCGLGRAVSSNKNAPDEFAIATKAPLVVPPDYALRPPKPGESRPQELSPSERAQQILLGDAATEPPTAGEQLFMQRAGVLSADPNIRAILGVEQGGWAEKDGSFANQLIFWNFNDGEIDDSAAPLRVENPDEWMAQRDAMIKSAIGESATVEINKSKTLNLPGIF